MNFRLCVLLCCIAWLLTSAGCAGDAASSRHASAERLFVDGQYGDWMKVTPLHTDPVGDGAADGIDLGRLWVGHDQQFVIFRIDVRPEINLQRENALTLYLDTDNDASTGQRVHGIGADLRWTFGERTGRFVHGADTTALTHADVGLVTAPTVSSTAVEVAIDRQARLHGGSPLFGSDTLHIALADGGAPDGDRLPDADGGVAYPLGEVTSLAPLDSVALESIGDRALRLVSYNVEFDGLFDAERAAAFARILQAVRPDLMGFQEIYEHSAAETRRVVEAMISPGAGRRWYSAKAGRDLVAVSRFPIRSVHEIPGFDRHASAAFVIDARTVLGSDLLFIVMHPPCCSGGRPPADVRRQRVVDHVLAFLREARSAGGALTVAPETPVVIAGDMNFVGDDRLPFSLRTGGIVDTARFGLPYAPDTDGSALADLAPGLTGWPMNFTWYDPESHFAPGRLDYIFFTDSVLQPVRRYVLFTPALSEIQLQAHRLQAGDAVRASDHLPLVVDFVPKRR